jgi:hypothetical protein
MSDDGRDVILRMAQLVRARHRLLMASITLNLAIILELNLGSPRGAVIGTAVAAFFAALFLAILY